MAKRKIVWTRTAAKQRKEVLKYWTLRNQTNNYAKSLLVVINKKTKLIAIFPEMYQLSAFPNTRVAAMGHFSIFYKYGEKRIIISMF